LESKGRLWRYADKLLSCPDILKRKSFLTDLPIETVCMQDVPSNLWYKSSVGKLHLNSSKKGATSVEDSSHASPGYLDLHVRCRCSEFESQRGAGHNWTKVLGGMIQH